jgi:pantoate kinase
MQISNKQLVIKEPKTYHFVTFKIQTMQDKIVNQVVSKYQQRSEIGIGKYNTTLQNNNADNFFKHAQEEAMDFSLYLEKIMQIVKETPNDAELGAKIRMMAR